MWTKANILIYKLSARVDFEPDTVELPMNLTILSVSRTAESACQIDDKAYQQNQPESAAPDDGSTKVQSAAAEEEKQNHYD